MTITTTTMTITDGHIYQQGSLLPGIEVGGEGTPFARMTVQWRRGRGDTSDALVQVHDLHGTLRADEVIRGAGIEALGENMGIPVLLSVEGFQALFGWYDPQVAQVAADAHRARHQARFDHLVATDQRRLEPLYQAGEQESARLGFQTERRFTPGTWVFGNWSASSGALVLTHSFWGRTVLFFGEHDTPDHIRLMTRRYARKAVDRLASMLDSAWLDQAHESYDRERMRREWPGLIAEMRRRLGEG